ncbi:7449_t:CDS:2 [Entrophospora sp. SA101]|nr:7449_t:CDS:2 [Entrophospora sp. SA101]CAJ0904747.1 14432_t:CDS:2 [Entrophospora sp. SA101]
MNMFTESTPCSCGFLPRNYNRSSKSERLSSELMQCAKVIVDNWKSPVAINSSLDT